MRERNGNAVRSWQQFESQLPKGWKIEPTDVGVEQNDTPIEDGLDVFNALVELSWIDKSIEEIFKELQIEELTNTEWEKVFLKEWYRVDKSDLPYIFLNKYYCGKWAYIKKGEQIFYGQVDVNSRPYKMKTSKGILKMPSVCVVEQSGDKHYVFFPMKALLSNDETSFNILYWQQARPENERQSIERQIMELLVKLATCGEKKTILETNTVFEKIEELCRNSGVIDKVHIENWMLKMHFIWRKVIDTDNNYVPMVLPPCYIGIDLRDYRIRGSASYHPHILNDNSLCLGGTLTDLAQRCIQNRDILTLIGGLIQFANSWTSSDADGSGREPAFCIKKYINEKGDESNWKELFESLGITREDIKLTIEGNLSSESFGGEFKRFIWANE